MRILFATTVLPHLQTSGGEIASQAFVDAMRAAGHQVRVFGFPRSDSEVPEGSVAMPIRPIETDSAGPIAYVWMAKAIFSGRPYVNEKFYSPVYRDRILAAGKDRADVLVLDHAQTGWLLPYADQLADKLIFIAHNHEASLYARQAQSASGGSKFKRLLVKRDASLLERLETALARKASQVWALSEAEKVAFDGLAGSPKSRLMSLPGRTIAQQEQTAVTADVGMLGTWAWEINRAGLEWFISEVYPLLPSTLRIHVGGRGSEIANGVGSNMKGAGFIDDPIQFMRSVKVLAIPTTMGAGIQLKTIEAIAIGTHIVSTPLGVRGIGPLPHYVHLAERPQDFAEALVRALVAPTLGSGLGNAWAQSRRENFNTAIADSLAALVSTQKMSGAA